MPAPVHRSAWFAAIAAMLCVVVWLLIPRRQTNLLQKVHAWIKTRPERQEFVDLETLDDHEAARLRTATGIDLLGYTRVLDSDAARKIIHDHGGDPNPISPRDIARALYHIRHAQKVKLSLKNTRQGLTAIEYYHKEGRTTVVIEEIRVGRRKLAVKTMYKQ